MGSFKETLPSVERLPLPYLSSLLLLSEQVLLEPTVEATPASLTKPRAMAIFALVPLADLTLELVPH